MLFRSKNREFGLNNWSCRCQPLLDLERPLFFSLYSSVFIWFRKLFERQLTDYTSSHTIKNRPQYLYLAGFTARSQDSHTLWRRPGMAGNGREWPKWDGGFESDRYSQHQPAQLEAQARPSKAARLSASVLLLKWSHEMPLKPCEASLQLASRTFGRSTDRRGANEWTRSEEIWTKTMTMMTYDDYELWRFLIIIDINGFNGRIIEPRSFALHWLGLPNQAQTLLGVSEALQV